MIKVKKSGFPRNLFIYNIKILILVSSITKAYLFLGEKITRYSQEHIRFHPFVRSYR